jgi:PAS domain S-box-containing protein
MDRLAISTSSIARAGRRLLRLLSAPPHPDQQVQRAVALANAVLWASVAGPVLYTLGTLAMPLGLAKRLPLLVAAVVPALGLWALRRGHLRATSLVLVATFLVVPVWGAADSGGIRAPAVMTLFVAIILAGQLLGVTAALVATAIAILEVAVLALATIGHWLPSPQILHSDQTYAVALIVELAACGGFAAFAARLVVRMLEHLRREQLALRNASEYLREAHEASPDAIVSLDASGVVTQTNHAHELLLGRPRDRIVGRHFAEIVPLSPENERLARERFATLLAGGRPALVSDVIRRDDGSEVPVEANLRLALRSDGSRTVEVVIRDVTERVLAERRQRELEAQLEDARRLEFIGRLAGGVAHDFNNLLTVILGSACDGVSPRTPERDRQRFDAIRDAAERAARLTRQLLTFARRQEISPRGIPLGRTLQEMRGLLARLLPGPIELHLDIDGDPVVRMDPGQLDQVVVNLVANARDAMPGGGRLRVALAPARLADAHARPPLPAGEYAALSVADSGAGMDPDILAHVFEPFFTTKPRGKGTGLGLATVRAIAQQSGGHVFVSSAPGQGTTFEVYLPIASEPSAEPRPRPLGRPAGATVIVVDDEREVRHSVAVTLGERGFRALEAADGAEAARLADQTGDAPCLLLSDLVMPHASGPAVARLLRARHPRLAVLFMSGAHAPEASDWTSVPGAHFIAKPFSPDDLIAHVTELLTPTPAGG